MIVIRNLPENRRRPKVVCTGCGKKASEAGIAVHDLAIEETVDDEGFLLMAIDDAAINPLCEACLVVMEAKEDVEVIGLER